MKKVDKFEMISLLRTWPFLSMTQVSYKRWVEGEK